MTRIFRGIGLLVLVASSTHAQTIDWPRYQEMAVDLMQQYLRINTSNPPGNELEAAKFFKRNFDQYGIESEIFEYKPGRANIIARLKGNGSKRPLILMSHMDVVTAKPEGMYHLLIEHRIEGLELEGDHSLLERLVEAASPADEPIPVA